MEYFKIGDKIRFRQPGEPIGTLSTIFKVDRVNVRVTLDEPRGEHPAGTRWRVSKSLCTKVFAGAPQSLGDILVSIRQSGQTARDMMSQILDLEMELGRPLVTGPDEFRILPSHFFEYPEDAPRFFEPFVESVVQSTSPVFCVGDKVRFTSDDGRVIVGHIRRLNAKSVTVYPVDMTTKNSRYWRVSPRILTKVI